MTTPGDIIQISSFFYRIFSKKCGLKLNLQQSEKSIMYADKHAWLLFPFGARKGHRRRSKIPVLKSERFKTWWLKSETQNNKTKFFVQRGSYSLFYFLSARQIAAKVILKKPVRFRCRMKVGQRWTVYHFILLWECILVLHTLQMEYKRLFLLKERFWQCFYFFFFRGLNDNYRKLRRKDQPTLSKRF